MIIVKPETNTSGLDIRNKESIFLAGSIEQGTAENWQSKMEKTFEKYNGVFYNPRREDWDSSWEQDENSPQFNYQVNWELDHLDKSDHIFMYFDPKTKSPITLMELGAYGHHKNIIVCCPKGFWRRGNVQIFTTRKSIPFYNNLDEAIGALRTKLHHLKDETN